MRAPLCAEINPWYALRFLGEVRAEGEDSAGSAHDLAIGLFKELGGDVSSVSAILFQRPGDTTLVIGEGNGVISAKGPSPGEESAEAGDREPPVY